MQIVDEFLRQLLSQNTTKQMKAIVETIQQEQDVAIRDMENDLLMVQGAAGSGKTSIALHRAAVLNSMLFLTISLYCEREIKSSKKSFLDWIFLLFNIVPSKGRGRKEEKNLVKQQIQKFVRIDVVGLYKILFSNEAYFYSLCPHSKRSENIKRVWEYTSENLELNIWYWSG